MNTLGAADVAFIMQLGSFLFSLFLILSLVNKVILPQAITLASGIASCAMLVAYIILLYV